MLPMSAYASEAHAMDSTEAYKLDSQTAMEMEESINRYRSKSIEAAVAPSVYEFSVEERVARIKEYYGLTVKYDNNISDALPTTLYYLESVCATLGTDFFPTMQPRLDELGITDLYLQFHSKTADGADDYYGYTEYTDAGSLSVHLFTGPFSEANYYVMFHELGHLLYVVMGDEDTGLNQLNGEYTGEVDNSKHMSRYGRYDSHEDFAEIFRVLMHSSPQPELLNTEIVLRDKVLWVYSSLFQMYGPESNVVRRVRYYLGLPL
jgi:hypothetical protein